MSDWPVHYCPCCGAAQKPFARYPWFICNDCRKTTSDRAGRVIAFGNAGFGGGLNWGYADSEDRYSNSSVLCLIAQRPVVVTEARFGGVVAQPLPDRAMSDVFYDLVDVRSGINADIKGLKPVASRRSGGTDRPARG